MPLYVLYLFRRIATKIGGGEYCITTKNIYKALFFENFPCDVDHTAKPRLVLLPNVLTILQLYSLYCRTHVVSFKSATFYHFSFDAAHIPEQSDQFLLVTTEAPQSHRCTYRWYCKLQHGYTTFQRYGILNTMKNQIHR